MAPGPKRTPRALRVAYSRPGSSDIEDAAEAPPVTEPPDPPDWLVGAGRAEWERIVPLMMEVGLLANMDLNTLGSYCECVRIVADSNSILDAKPGRGRPKKNAPPRGMVVISPNGAPYLNPLHTAKMQAMRDMSRYAQTLGLTPSARASISVGDSGGHGKVGKTPAQNRDADLGKKFKI
jgi:P27 family predicted phage terminase small subunit